MPHPQQQSFLLNHMINSRFSRLPSRHSVLKRSRKAKKHGFLVLKKFLAERQDGFYAGKTASVFQNGMCTEGKKENL